MQTFIPLQRRTRRGRAVNSVQTGLIRPDNASLDRINSTLRRELRRGGEVRVQGQVTSALACLSGHDKLRLRGELDGLRNALPNFGSLSGDEVKTILDFVESNCEHDMISLLPMIPHTLPASFRERFVSPQVFSLLGATLKGDRVAIQDVAHGYASRAVRDPGVLRAMGLVVASVGEAGPQERRVLVGPFCEKLRAELEELRHAERVESLGGGR